MNVKVEATRTASWTVVDREYGPRPEEFQISDDASPSEILKKVASILPKLAKELGTPYPIKITISLYGKNKAEKVKELSERLSSPAIGVYHTIDEYDNIVIPSGEVSIFSLKRKLEQL